MYIQTHTHTHTHIYIHILLSRKIWIFIKAIISLRKLDFNFYNRHKTEYNSNFFIVISIKKEKNQLKLISLKHITMWFHSQAIKEITKSGCTRE